MFTYLYTRLYHVLCARIGLELNGAKCEVIPTAGLHSHADRDLFQSDFAFNTTGNSELLGGPIGSQEYCNQHTGPGN